MRVSPRSRRVIAIILAGLGFLYLAYGIAVYVALRSGVLAKLTREVDDLKVDARGGYSLWPGRVVLHDASLSFKDYNIEVRLEARELRLVIAFLPFFEKTIQVDEFHARDARYKMLHRVHDGQKNRERIAAFPDTGFARPKVYDTPSEPYQVPTFTVRVENIHGNVLEAWILEYRALGDFRAEGGFEVSADVTVYPSHVTLENGQIFVGEERLAERARCDLSAQIGPFPGKDELMKVVGATSGKIECQLSMSDLSALDVYWPDSELELEGRSEVQTDLTFVRGQLRSSSARAETEIRTLGFGRASLAGALDLRLSADERGEVQAALEFREAKDHDGLLDLAEMKVELEAEQPQISQMSLEEAQIEVKGLGVRDPSFLRHVAGSRDAPLAKIEGAQLDLSYLAASDEKKGSLKLDSRGAVAFFPEKDARITCAYRASVRCALEEKKGECGGSELDCFPFVVDQGERGEVRAALRAETLTLSPGSVRSDWGVALSNPKDLLRVTVATNVWAELGLTLLPLGEVAGRVRVNRKDGTIGGTVDAFRAGGLSGRGAFLFADSLASRWLIDTPVARFSVSQSHTGTQVSPFAPSDWDVLAFDR